jgi:hypothetical protein
VRIVGNILSREAGKRKAFLWAKKSGLREAALEIEMDNSLFG